MRDYFSSLGDSAHPNSPDPRARAITKFQELLLVSFREFAVITEDTIFSERRRFRNEIISSIESFSKRASIRNLKTLERFRKEQVGSIYDALFKAVCVEPPPAPAPVPISLLTTKDVFEERPETRIGPKTFRVFLSEIATWARDEKVVINGFQVCLPDFSVVGVLLRCLAFSNESTVRLQITNSLIACSSFGITHVWAH
jgi:hypothetical protein